MHEHRAAILPADAPTAASVFGALCGVLREAVRRDLPGLSPQTLLAEVPDLGSLRVLEAEFGAEIRPERLESLARLDDVVSAIIEAVAWRT